MKKLNRKDYVIIGLGVVSVVSTGAAIYFGIKYGEELRNFKEYNSETHGVLIDAHNALVDRVEKSEEESKFIKTLVVEGELLPTSMQNIKNKMERCLTKIDRAKNRLEVVKNDNAANVEIIKNTKEYMHLLSCLTKAEQLRNAIESDDVIYAE